MITNPIIPIWVMSVICAVLLVLKRKGIAPYIRQIVMIILLFMINLRIQVPNGEFETKIMKAKAYVVFAIDDTISMLAEDYNGTHQRLEGVRKDVGDIVDNIYGARFTLIKFSNESEVASPSTTDGEFIKSAVNAIYPPNTYFAKGTNINVAKSTIEDTVKRLKSKGDGKVFLVFISDGEMNNNNTLESFASVSEYIDGGAVLGYGTDKGGRMFYQEYGYEGHYIEADIYGSKDAISYIDENNLKSIAGDLGVNYYNMNKTASKTVYEDLKKNISYEEEENKTEGRSDIYFYFAMALAAMLVFEMIMYKKKK